MEIFFLQVWICVKLLLSVCTHCWKSALIVWTFSNFSVMSKMVSKIITTSRCSHTSWWPGNHCSGLCSTLRVSSLQSPPNVEFMAGCWRAGERCYVGVREHNNTGAWHGDSDNNPWPRHPGHAMFRLTTRKAPRYWHVRGENNNTPIYSGDNGTNWHDCDPIWISEGIKTFPTNRFHDVGRQITRHKAWRMFPFCLRLWRRQHR